jgi:acyl carrier protein
MDDRASIRAESNILSNLEIGETTPALTDRVFIIVAEVLRNRNPIVELFDRITFPDLGLDALDRIFIADALEREWSIELDEDEIDGWQTLDNIAMSVRNLMP